MASSERSLDGWLSKMVKTKAAGRAPMWQRRWFTLRGDVLSFFNSPDLVSEPPKWTLDLGTLGASTAPAPGDMTCIELQVGGESTCCLPAQQEIDQGSQTAPFHAGPGAGRAVLQRKEPAPAGGGTTGNELN